MPKLTGERHLVRAVVFEPKTNVGPCECTCGWWGPSSDFTEHRKLAGAKAFSGNAVQSELSYDQPVYGAAAPATSGARAFEG